MSWNDVSMRLNELSMRFNELSMRLNEVSMRLNEVSMRLNGSAWPLEVVCAGAGRDCGLDDHLENPFLLWCSKPCTLRLSDKYPYIGIARKYLSYDGSLTSSTVFSKPLTVGIFRLYVLALGGTADGSRVVRLGDRVLPLSLLSRFLYTKINADD